MSDPKGNEKFRIDYKEDGVYLELVNPSTQIPLVTIDEILMKVVKKKIRDLNKRAIELLLISKSTQPELIAPPQEEEPLDAYVTVYLDEAKMKANIVIYPPEGGNELTKEQILEAMTLAGIKSGIDMEIVESLAEKPQHTKHFLVAEGKMPQNGTNGKLVYNFNTKADHTPTLLEDGRVDYKELNFVQSVMIGKVLVELIDHTLGTSGMDVTGKEILGIDGKPAIMPVGKNVEVSADGKFLIAICDGSVELVDGKVNVFQLLEIKENVDVSTGNIHFIGSIIVHGGVGQGYSIEAQGNIEVEGLVEGGTLIAGGDITLKRGATAKTHIYAGHDVVAKYLENVYVEARNNVTADVIMHSKVNCGNKMICNGSKGFLVGGLARVGKEVVVKIAGSHMSTVTEIEVGIDPTAKERMMKLKEDLTRSTEDVKKTEQIVSILKRFELAGQLTPDKKEMLDKSIKTVVILNESIQSMTEEYEELEEKTADSDKGKVEILGTVYPGVKVLIGSGVCQVKDVMNSGTFTKYEDYIKFTK